MFSIVPSLKDGRTEREPHPDHCRYCDSTMGIVVHCSQSTLLGAVCWTQQVVVGRLAYPSRRGMHLQRPLTSS